MPHSKLRQAALALVVVAVALLPACEDSPLLAPEGSQVVVTANPSRVVLDPGAGQSTANATIRAQFFGENNVPLEGLSVVFSSSGGQLASANATVAPETDGSGVAIDVLTVGTADVGDVVVTARSGTLVESTNVAVARVGVNQQPIAAIVATPSMQQRINSPVTFSGATSNDPDGDPITCYEWRISSSIAARNETVRGVGVSSVTRTYTAEQDLNVELKVSDNPAIAASCTQGGAPDPSLFSPLSAVVAYSILCDTTPPIAEAGPQQNVSLSAGGGLATVTVDGGMSSDPQSGIASYRWDCRNGTPAQMGQSVVCSYTALGTYSVLLTVTNGCGQTASDTVNIVVQP